MRVLLIVSEDWDDADLLMQSVKDLIQRNYPRDYVDLEFLAECYQAQKWAQCIGSTTGQCDWTEAHDLDHDLCLAFIKDEDPDATKLASVMDSADVPTVRFCKS